MDYNKLRTFTVVAEHQSISIAADKLYRTQPAISNQLKDLEESLGVILFERKHAKIFLTREGEIIQQEAVKHLRALDDVVLRIKDDKASAEGTIRLAIEADSVGTILAQMLKGFKAEYPNVNFEVVSAGYGDIDELLLNNKVDFSFQVLYTHKDFFVCEPVYSFTRTLAATDEYLSNMGPIKTVKDLATHNLIAFYSPTGDIRHWLKSNNQTKHISLFERENRAIVVKDAYTLNEMVYAGLGVGFMFDNMADGRKLINTELVPLFPGFKTMRGTLDLAYKKVRNESYLFEAFKNFVLDNRAMWNQGSTIPK